MSKALFVSVAALALGSAVAARRVSHAQRPAVQVWVASESEKVLPTAEADAPPRPAIALDLAGQDCAGAQIAVRASRGLSQLRARADALSGAGGPLAVRVSRVATIALAKPSGPDGRAGEWPDALIPERDAIYDEPRRAFPIDLPAQRTQAIFVEVCAPAGQGAGKYAGAVRLSWAQDGKPGGASVPIAARVRGFSLPATPRLATAFGFSGYSAVQGHHLPAAENLALTRLYDRMALERGITLFGGTQDAPPHRRDGDRFIIDWTNYDAEVADFLDGKALPSGARWTAVELREPAKLSREDRRDYRKAWLEHFQQRGWADRLFAYVHDEPAESIFSDVESKAAELREDLPRARRLVTTALSPKLGSIDLWTPLLNCFDPAGPSVSCARPVTRSEYAAAEKAGARVFWYQSCASHGCGKEPATDAGYRGWPSYAIDAPATAARAMGSLAFENRIDGELYYDVVLAYDGDVWRDQWRFGGNGDGTLYYPGRPDAIGGEHHVPVESLRVIQISRALGDHAALSLCKELGDGALAARVAKTLAPGLRSWERDPKKYAESRSQLYDRIEQLRAVRKAHASQ